MEFGLNQVNSFILITNLMPFKWKILWNGYKIMMHNILGTGSYGTVNIISNVYRGEQDGAKLLCTIKIV